MFFASLRRCSLVALALASAGCATIFNSNRDRVQIYSTSGVRSVFEENRPIPVRVAPDNPAAYEVTLDPHRAHHLAITTGTSVHRVETSRSVGAGWVVLDVFCHPLICPIVDAATGAWTSFDPIYLVDPAPGAIVAPVVPVVSAPAPTPTPTRPPAAAPVMLEPIVVAPWQATVENPAPRAP